MCLPVLSKQTLRMRIYANICEKRCTTWAEDAHISYLTGRLNSMSVDMIIINLRISFLSISQIWMICQAGNQFSVAALAKLLFHTSDKQVIKSQSYFIMKKTSATTNLTSDEWRILMFSEILSRVFLLLFLK